MRASQLASRPGSERAAPFGQRRGARKSRDCKEISQTNAAAGSELNWPSRSFTTRSSCSSSSCCSGAASCDLRLVSRELWASSCQLADWLAGWLAPEGRTCFGSPAPSSGRAVRVEKVFRLLESAARLIESARSCCTLKAQLKVHLAGRLLAGSLGANLRLLSRARAANNNNNEQPTSN